MPALQLTDPQVCCQAPGGLRVLVCHKDEQGAQHVSPAPDLAHADRGITKGLSMRPTGTDRVLGIFSGWFVTPHWPRL